MSRRFFSTALGYRVLRVLLLLSFVLFFFLEIYIKKILGFARLRDASN